MKACVLIPYFAAAVERRDDPSLAVTSLVIRELSGDSVPIDPLRPAYAGRRGTVFAVSYETAQMGVEPGMTLRQAQILCPQARFIPADRGRYQRAFDEFLEVLTGFAPGVEPDGPQPTAIGYLDLGHLKRNEIVEMAQDIGQTVRQAIRLAPAIGLAVGKFPAYVAAASAEPNKALIVSPGREATFLAPFPVDLLPLGGETSRRLQLLGIHTLGQLAALPPSAVMNQFGAPGRLLRHMAQGHDDRPIFPRHPEVMERVSRQYDSPIADRTVLETIAQTMAVELAGRLQARGLVGRKLRLILYLENEATREEQLVMRQPTSNPGRLTHILSELIARARVQQGVREVEITLADLIPATGQQLDLFIHQTGQGNRLREVLKDLVARHGADCFYQVSLIDQAIPLPERRFRLRKVDTL